MEKMKIYQLVELTTQENDASVLIYTFSSFEIAQKFLDEKIKQYKDDFEINNNKIDRNNNFAYIDARDDFQIKMEIIKIDLEKEINIKYPKQITF
jgi:hypothetical protein